VATCKGIRSCIYIRRLDLNNVRLRKVGLLCCLVEDITEWHHTNKFDLIITIFRRNICWSLHGRNVSHREMYANVYTSIEVRIPEDLTTVLTTWLCHKRTNWNWRRKPQRNADIYLQAFTAHSSFAATVFVQHRVDQQPQIVCLRHCIKA